MYQHFFQYRLKFQFSPFFVLLTQVNNFNISVQIISDVRKLLLQKTKMIPILFQSINKPKEPNVDRVLETMCLESQL